MPEIDIGERYDYSNYCHRGSKGVRPENTIVAFNKAIDEGADGIETDVHLSKDGKLVIIHDEMLIGPQMEKAAFLIKP